MNDEYASGVRTRLVGTRDGEIAGRCRDELVGDIGRAAECELL